MKKFWITLLSVLTLALGLFGIVACSSTDYLSSYLLKEDGSLVEADFVLPSTINEQEVKWSSDKAAITVEKRTEDWLAKVNLGDQQETVTLTVSCGKEKKEFHVTVAALDVSYFVSNYKFKQAQSTVFADFDLETSTTINGKTASIAWYAGRDGEGNFVKEGEYIKINADGNKCEVTQSSLNPEVRIYATFTYGTQTQTTNYRMTVSFERDHLEEVDYWYYNTGVSITMSGYVVAIGTAYANDYKNVTLYMVDDDFCAGYYLYRVKASEADGAKLEPGVHVTVTNTTNTNYNGLIETNAGGNLVVDKDKPEIDISEHVAAIDDDILANSPAALYHTSTLVSLEKWTVKSVAKDAPEAGASSTLFTLTKGGVDVTVGVSKYMEGVYLTNKENDTWNALAALQGTIKVGDVVSVSGILGNYKGYQILPLKADDVKKEEGEATAVKAEYTNTAKAVKAVQDAFKGQGVTYAGTSAYTIVADKEITVPTEVEGVTISYKVLRDAPTVTYETGKLVVTAGNEDIATVEITYTCGDYTTKTYHNIHSVKMSDQDVVEKVKFDLEIAKQTAESISLKTKVDQYPGAEISYAVKEAVDGVKISTKGDKLEIVPSTTTERTIVLVATFTYGEATDTKEYTIKVVKVDPVETGTFKLAIQLSKTKTLYFTGEMDGFYGELTDWYYDAIDVVVAEVENGYTLKAGDNYIELVASGNYIDFALKPEANADTAWKYDYSLKTFTWEVNGKVYYLGTYKASSGSIRESIGASETKYISGDNASKVGDSQFVIAFEKPINKTDKDKAKDVLAVLPDTFEVDKAGDTKVPVEGPLEGVTLAYSFEEGVTVATYANGVITVAELPAEEVKFKVTVTVTSGNETASKKITVTVKAKPASKPVPTTDLKLISGSFTQLNPSESSAYAKFNGTHTVGDYEVTTNQVMTNKSNGYDVIQMQAEKATITLDGNFTKVIIVIVSTYDFDNSGNDISVYAGDTKLTATLTNTETNGDVKVYTVEYTVEGTGAQTFKVAKEGKFAAYAVSIDFKVAEAAE